MIIVIFKEILWSKAKQGYSNIGNIANIHNCLMEYNIKLVIRMYPKIFLSSLCIQIIKNNEI